MHADEAKRQIKQDQRLENWWPLMGFSKFDWDIFQTMIETFMFIFMVIWNAVKDLQPIVIVFFILDRYPSRKYCAT